MPYHIYNAISNTITSIAWISSPLLALLPRNFSYRIQERLANYKRSEPNLTKPVIWFHAASVGESRVVENILPQLIKLTDNKFDIVITLTTPHGHQVATNTMGSQATVFMAPLDNKRIIKKFLTIFAPRIFIGVETEFWPITLNEIKKRKIAACLINGRISDKSFRIYRSRLFINLINKAITVFNKIATISEQDKEKFISLGIDEEKIIVSGNSKYNSKPKKDPAATKRKYREILQADDESLIWICGSTRPGEEEALITVYQQLKPEWHDKFIWVMAPRHINRVKEIKELLDKSGIKAETLSLVRETGKKSRVIIVDSIGELSDIYSAGDFCYCGGSLMDYGGHNIMEIIQWGIPPYFGPYMGDFRDGVKMVLEKRAGFQIKDKQQLADLLSFHYKDPKGKKEYQQACMAAKNLAWQGSSAIRQQAEMIFSLL